MTGVIHSRSENSSPLSLSSRTGGWVATIGKAQRRRGNNCRPCGRCRPLKPAISFTLWQNEKILPPRELHFDGNITNRGFQAILDAFLLRQQLGENAAPNVLEQTTKAVDFFAKHVSVNFPRWPRSLEQKAAGNSCLLWLSTGANYLSLLCCSSK